jgi:hypothetical protein
MTMSTNDLIWTSGEENSPNSASGIRLPAVVALSEHFTCWEIAGP